MIYLLFCDNMAREQHPKKNLYSLPLHTILDSQHGDIILEMKGITCQFPGVLANDHIDFSLRKGEIHALLGENGAGKTTLMNILYGLLQPNEGQIAVGGSAVSIRSPHEAMKLGIGMVHQHFKLFEGLSAAENIFFGQNNVGKFYLSKKQLYKETENLFKLYNIKANPSVRIRQLPLGTRQKIEITKTLYRGAQILIMDEPTAVLTPQETKELFDMFKGMTKEGRSIIFITHKLEEVFMISDRITVLKTGKFVATIAKEDADKVSLARMMVDRDVLFRLEKVPMSVGDDVFRVQNLRIKGNSELSSIKDCTFSILSGEIFAIAGVAGNGQRELVEGLTGMRPVQSGSVIIGNKVLTNRSPREIRDSGIGVIPEDRDRFGLILDFSLTENLILDQTHYAPFVKRGFLRKHASKEHSKRLVDEFDIQPPQVDVLAKTLSGGNRQKLLLARELSQYVKCLIVCEPTRGLDIGASEYIRQKILEQKNKGAAILLISSDLDEILSLSDRIGVIFDGQFAGFMKTDKFDLEKVGLLMAGLSLAQT